MPVNAYKFRKSLALSKFQVPPVLTLIGKLTSKISMSEIKQAFGGIMLNTTIWQQMENLGKGFIPSESSPLGNFLVVPRLIICAQYIKYQLLFIKIRILIKTINFQQWSVGTLFSIVFQLPRKRCCGGSSLYSLIFSKLRLLLNSSRKKLAHMVRQRLSVLSTTNRGILIIIIEN